MAADPQTTKVPRADLIAWMIELGEVTGDEGGMIPAVIDLLRSDAEYKCTKGHDLCHTMSPCKECPTCEFRD